MNPRERMEALPLIAILRRFQRDQLPEIISSLLRGGFKSLEASIGVTVSDTTPEIRIAMPMVAATLARALSRTRRFSKERWVLEPNSSSLRV